ncbi:hypothetical protein CVT26_012445 [Gymnopilus dilepis]|uniref:Uncharacterized protein n=1 Tax=Gymnopilus dilepis TaxID=231916 RepID=A0A409YW72_9AGAR|nr:hypothetical protein CVT26_012445 [Gymnopilus dilepis]
MPPSALVVTPQNAKFQPGAEAKLREPVTGNKVAKGSKPEVVFERDVVLGKGQIVQIMGGPGMTRVKEPFDTSQSGTLTLKDYDFEHRICKVYDERRTVDVNCIIPEDQVKIHHNSLSPLKNGKPDTTNFYDTLMCQIIVVYQPTMPLYYLGTTQKYRKDNVTRELKKGDKVWGTTLNQSKGIEHAWYKLRTVARDEFRVVWKSKLHVSEKYVLEPVA